MHEAEPVRNGAAHVLDTFDVAMHDDGEESPGQMPGVVPPGKLQLLGLLGVLAGGAGGIGIAAIGAHQPVHHQLQR